MSIGCGGGDRRNGKKEILGNNRACGLAITGQSGGAGKVELLLFPLCSQVIELEEGGGERK